MNRSKNYLIFFFLSFLLFNLLISNFNESFYISNNYNKHMDFILDLQIFDEINSDNYGGFESFEGESVSNLEYTFLGVDLLKLFNGLNEINKLACIEYITGRNLIDGGYEPEANMFISYIDSTYFAVKSLNLLDADSWIQTDTPEWVGGRQNHNSQDGENYGGFEWKENFNTSFMEATYYGIQLTIELNSFYTINPLTARDWILSQENFDGGFGPTASISFSTIKDTYYAQKTLINMHNPELINKESMISYVKSLQNLTTSSLINYGGFKPFEGSFNTTLESTYYAIKILAELEELEQINSSVVLQYVYSKEVEMGGFKDTRSNYPNIADTYYAIKIQSIIEDWEIKDNNGNRGSLKNTFIPIFVIVGIIGFIFFFKYLKTPQNPKRIKIKVKRGK